MRLIDMNLNIQHASDMARLGASDSQGRPEVAAQQFAQRLEKQAKQQQEQVNKTNETEKNDVNADRQGHGGGYQGNKHRAKKKPEPEKRTMVRSNNGESLFDIRV